MNKVDLLIIRAVAEGKVVRGTELLAQRRVAQLDAKAAPASVRLAEKRRRRAGRDEDQAKRDMHDAVFTWNLEHTRDAAAPAGRCDACGLPFRHAGHGHCDHWIERSQGGDHTRENGWRLCAVCHQAKTDNRPSRAWWNHARGAYCAEARIPFVPRRERT